MTDDIEKIFLDVKDSTKMEGMGDRLEEIVKETKMSAGFTGARVLTDEQLDMVAGGVEVEKLQRAKPY